MVSKNQIGFMVGRSTIEAINLIRKFMKFYKDRKKDLNIVFIDLGKAYVRVSREVFCSWLETKSIAFDCIQLLNKYMIEQKRRR